MKRHTTQDDKQRTGQYFTTNASALLSGYENIVRNAKVVEPFAGGGDLVEWCYNNVQQFEIKSLINKYIDVFSNVTRD